MPCKLDEMLGGTVIKRDGQSISTETFTGKGKVVGLYFSAHWCPPCRSFTPVLAEKYKSWKVEHPEFEIVFLSSDRSESEFFDYFKGMPWLALSFGNDEKNKLSEMFGIRGIPTLVILNGETGEVITKDGRSDATSSERFPAGWRC